jgi:hypothetical protein
LKKPTYNNEIQVFDELRGREREYVSVVEDFSVEEGTKMWGWIDGFYEGLGAHEGFLPGIEADDVPSSGSGDEETHVPTGTTANIHHRQILFQQQTLFDKVNPFIQHGRRFKHQLGSLLLRPKDFQSSCVRPYRIGRVVGGDFDYAVKTPSS